MDACPPIELTDWIAQQEQAPEKAPDDHRRSITIEIDRLIRGLFSNLFCRALSDLSPYRHRVWSCLEYHWRSFAESGLIRFTEVVRKIEHGELHYGVVGNNVLSDVVLAVGLEDGETGAVRLFESDYMPIVRAVARRIGGQSAVDCVENFAAELVIPRTDRPPRIRTYQGRTPLASWLRSVVANYWISQTRGQTEHTMSAPTQIQVRHDPSARAEREDCEELLKPMFTNVASALSAEDRLILQMLILDGVPQHELARALGLNSGTVTRRRQRAVRLILERIHQLAAESQRQQDVADCLQLTVAGDDHEVRQRLGEILAEGLGPVTEDKPL